MSASMPVLLEEAPGELGVLGRDPHAVREVLDRVDAGVRGHRQHDAGPAGRWPWSSAARRGTRPRCRLLDPVAAGDAEVEQALGDVARDLLGPQDAHLVDAGVVDRRPGSRRRTSGCTARSAASNSSRVARSSEPLGRTSFSIGVSQRRRLGQLAQEVGHLDGGHRPPRSPCCPPWCRPARSPARWCRW